jgi:hypothetical protein
VYTTNLAGWSLTNGAAIPAVEWTAAYTADSSAVAGDAYFTLSGTDFEIDGGSTSYYVLKANITKWSANDNDDYVKVEFSAFDGGELQYKSNDLGNNDTSITDARLGITKLDGTQINE